MQELIFGKLTLKDLPHEWFTLGGSVTAMLGGAALFFYLYKAKKFTWLWKSWLTSTDPKKIGIMYMAAALFMLARGGLDAIMIWLQQVLAPMGMGYLSPTHFQEITSAHGSIMILFVTMGFL